MESEYSLPCWRRPRHLTVSWARSVQSSPSKLICLKINFNIIIPSTPRPSEPFLQISSPNTSMYLSPSPTCNMPRASPSWSDIINNIWWRLKIMNLLAVIFPTVLYYLVRLRTKYLLQRAVFQHPHFKYFPHLSPTLRSPKFLQHPTE